jgi:CheY-like chemotaxis protein
MERLDILIADDEPFVTRSLSYVLEREGWTVAAARDGEEALAMARRFNPRMLFLDIMMPIRTGPEVCERLKSDPRSRSIYIVMLTAKGQKEDRTESLSAGANEFITKPFSPRSVADRVREILEPPE